MKYTRSWISVWLIFMSFYAQGQDISFSQFYSSPIQLNPALAGQFDECARIATNYRNQWPSIPNAFQTYQVSYDQSISSTQTSFGVIINSDQQGNNVYTENYAGGIFAYQFYATEDLVVSAGLQTSFYQNSLNEDNLDFADTDVSVENYNASFVDFSGGLAFDYKRKYFGGIAVHHMTEPDDSFEATTNSSLPMRITAHGGATYIVDPAIYEKKSWEFSPNFMYVQQGKFHQVNLGLYTHVEPFTFGAWFRHNFENPDAAIILLGLQLGKVNLGYSYDYALSQLSGNAGGAHEISLSYRFCIYVERSKKVRAIKCPEF